MRRHTYIRVDQSFANISELALPNLVHQVHVLLSECLAKYWTRIGFSDFSIVSSSCCVCVCVKVCESVKERGEM